MPMAGRGFIISDQALESSGRIVAKVPNDILKIPKGLRRPVWARLEFMDTALEREHLARKTIRHQEKTGILLRAHGTSDCSSLCQILLDGQLKHFRAHENYGVLSAITETIQTNGYWDYGWGVFVATEDTVDRNRLIDNGERYYVIDLDELEAILLPTPIVTAVRQEFPRYRHLIMGYTGFSDKLLTSGT